MAFYRKPSPETMKKRREEYKNLYSITKDNRLGVLESSYLENEFY